MTRTNMAILKVLSDRKDSIVGSREISKGLRLHGIELTERTVRYYLKMLDERGLTKAVGKEGRKITKKGLEEMSSSHVSDKVGFIISKIENLSYQVDFDLDAMQGKVILNVSFFPEKDLGQALKAMRPLFQSPFVMSDRVVLAGEGGRIGGVGVPEGKVGVGTICSVTINGIFLKAGVPVLSKYGGLLQVNGDGPTRFTALISYEGSSLDPLLVFIKGGMTSVTDAKRHGEGNLLASFREIPAVCVERGVELQEKLKRIGMCGVLAVGGPNRPLCQIPVGMDRAGIVVVGGLNPIAAVEEAGIPTVSEAMAVLFEYSALRPFREAAKAL